MTTVIAGGSGLLGCSIFSDEGSVVRGIDAKGASDTDGRLDGSIDIGAGRDGSCWIVTFFCFFGWVETAEGDRGRLVRVAGLEAVSASSLTVVVSGRFQCV